MNELFSVVIPTFNRAHSVVKTLDSVLAQTYRPIEIILVDDGSTDQTVKTVSEWWLAQSEQSSLFFKQLTQKNSGAAAARNRGFQEVSGSYLQYLDSDDLILPERFSRIVCAMEEAGADFVQTSIESFDPETGEVTGSLIARPWANQVELVLNGQFWANTLRSSMSVELAQRIGPFVEEMTCFEDREYFERAVLMAHKPIAIDGVLARLARGKGEHVSHRHTSFEGRQWRIFCESQLVENVIRLGNLPLQWQSTLADRIYRLGCRSNASGWYQYGRQCGKIADKIQAPRTLVTYVKRLLCFSGFLGKVIYLVIDVPKQYMARLSK